MNRLIKRTLLRSRSTLTNIEKNSLFNHRFNKPWSIRLKARIRLQPEKILLTLTIRVSKSHVLPRTAAKESTLSPCGTAKPFSNS